jgi:hypothetical protein
MTAKTQNMNARQTFAWVRASEIEMAPPQWGRPVLAGDVRAIAANFDPDRFGSIAVWLRVDLPIGRGHFVALDGQHRLAAVRLIGWDDQRVPCLVYEGLTIESAAELSLGLQERRNLHALDRHRALLAAHDRKATEIDKVLHALGLEFSYNTKAETRGKVSAVSTTGHVWDCMGVTGLERVLLICGQAWGQTSAGYATNVLRLVMIIIRAHDGEIDDVTLGKALSSRSPAQWIAKDSTPRRSLASLAQDVINEYNKKARGSHRAHEKTQGEYSQAARRPPSTTWRGAIEHVLADATVARGGQRRRQRTAQKPT